MKYVCPICKEELNPTSDGAVDEYGVQVPQFRHKCPMGNDLS
jgi:hypothetical protein